jgi:hypothetical protein
VTENPTDMDILFARIRYHGKKSNKPSERTIDTQAPVVHKLILMHLKIKIVAIIIAKMLNPSQVGELHRF